MSFIYIHISGVHASSECSGESVHMPTHSPKPSLFAEAKCNEISCTGPKLMMIMFRVVWSGIAQPFSHNFVYTIMLFSFISQKELKLKGAFVLRAFKKINKLPSRSQFTNQHYCLSIDTIVEIFTPSLFLYCFGNLTIKSWLSQSLIFYKNI